MCSHRPIASPSSSTTHQATCDAHRGGPHRPDEGRSKNRRIAVVVLPEELGTADLPKPEPLLPAGGAPEPKPAGPALP